MAVGAVVTLAGLGVPVQAQAERHFFERVYLGCETKTNPYTGGTLIAANPRYILGTRAHQKNNLRSLKIQARLVPPGPGLNWNRPWRTTEVKNVRPDDYNRRQLGVLTNYENDAAEWMIEVRLTWHRRGKRDWKYTKKQRFACNGLSSASP